MCCMNYHPCYPTPVGYCYPVMMSPVIYPRTVVHEIEVDATTTSAQALVGGAAPSRLTVEYLAETGAASPSVTVTVVSDGQTATWTETNIAPGYYVRELSPAKPGSKLTLQSSNALARLRWCELICC
jgi:hypothetical protein